MQEGWVIGYMKKKCIALKPESMKLLVAPESTRAKVSLQPAGVLTLIRSKKCRLGEVEFFE
jgi:hypothetical protein